MPGCETCTDLSALNHQTTLAHLESSIRTGCPGCLLLVKAIRCFPKEYDQTKTIRWIVDRALYIQLLTTQDRVVTVLEIFRDKDTTSLWPIIGPGRSVLPGRWTSAHIELVKAWLSCCVSRDAGHVICQEPASVSLPTRVIDVGTSGYDMRLHQPAEGEEGQYIALSHCWGTSKPVQTTKATLQSHLEGISCDIKSQTFIDAAQIARDLNIQYLWIDSLCIVQDDSDDWESEAAKMSQVYSNATLTISAEAAANASQGLFHASENRTRLHSQHVVEYDCSSGTKLSVYVRKRNLTTTRIGEVTNFAHGSGSLAVTKLSKRAWVLQERLLSRRMLHFFEEEMAWSCCSISHCECRLDAGMTDANVFKKLHDSNTSVSARAYDLQLEWPKVVMEFTKRKLTKYTDRLPALSGLAKLYADATSLQQPTYCAGLWADDLSYSLLWSSDHRTAQPDIIQRNKGGGGSFFPSWSWASTTGPVSYFDRHLNQFERRSRQDEVIPTLEVIHFVAQPNGPNVFGNVNLGLILVRGQMIRVRYNHISEQWRPWDSKIPGLNPITKIIPIEDRRTEQDRSTTNTSPLDNADLYRMKPRVVPDVLTEAVTWSDGNGLYFLRAARLIISGQWTTSRTENMCLLLRRIIDPAAEAKIGVPLFKREGMVIHGFSSDTTWAERFAPVRTIAML